MKKTKKVLRSVFAILLSLTAAFSFAVILITDALPEHIFVKTGEAKVLPEMLSFLYSVDCETQDVLSLTGDSLKQKGIKSVANGSADLQINLFGFIPLKNIAVTVGKERMLVPGGESIGVMLYTDGALVVGCSEIETDGNEKISPGKTAGLRPGDVIKNINGIEVENAAQLSKEIENAGGEVRLGIIREGKRKEIELKPERDAYDGRLRLGVWVRDSTAGVGTLTFYDPVMQRFAGLGHAITDIDTGQALSVKNGEVVMSKIIEVVKSSQGSPGALKGSFNDSSEIFGHIVLNSQLGLYGKGEESPKNGLYDMLAAGEHERLHKGEASILCSIDDRGVREYSCEIVNVSRQFAPSQKSFVVKVTDSELLNKTGGIVQGMSGSPVLQDGKLVGAVTHVIVNDPQLGYGIYIDWMLNEMETF